MCGTVCVRAPKCMRVCLFLVRGPHVLCLQVMTSSSLVSAVADNSLQLIVPASLVELPTGTSAFEHPTSSLGRPIDDTHEAQSVCEASQCAGGIQVAPGPWPWAASVPAPLTRDGASTSDSESLGNDEMAKLVTALLQVVAMPVTVHDGEDLRELQLRFEGQSQGGR
jgi:hypothetical protein